MVLCVSKKLVQNVIRRRLLQNALQTSLRTNLSTLCSQASVQKESHNVAPWLDDSTRDQQKDPVQDADHLCKVFSRFSLSPTEINFTKQYILPSLHKVIDVAILDPMPDKMVRECPEGAVKPKVEAPLRGGTAESLDLPVRGTILEKHAKLILYIRHRKMKKHKYKKWKKRNRFLIKAMKVRRLKKRRKKWEAWVKERRFQGLMEKDIEQFLLNKKRNEDFELKFRGIPVEEFTEDEKRQREEQKRKDLKKITTLFDPLKSGMIIPHPIVPPNANINENVFNENKA